jgi:hypothetical protein
LRTRGAIRNLPKVAWLLIVLFFPVVGSIAWLVAGRPGRRVPATGARERAEEQRRRYEQSRKPDPDGEPESR